MAYGFQDSSPKWLDPLFWTSGRTAMAGSLWQSKNFLLGSKREKEGETGVPQQSSGHTPLT